MKMLAKWLYISGLVLGIFVFGSLIIYSFWPHLINVDRYTFYFIGVLLMLVTLPTLKRGKLMRIFEFTRNIGKLAKKAAKKKKKV